MRYENFKKNEYYQIVDRAVGTTSIFLDDADRSRFIFLIIYFQSPIQIYNVSWYAKRFLEKGSFMANENKTKDILKKRNISLIAFSLSEQGFDIAIKNLEDGILSVYMHRVLTAYSKYFNKKYNKKGHVFAGPFQSMHIKNKDDLLRTSAEIHSSPKESNDAFWSSLHDYVDTNRWGELLNTDLILSQFKNEASYRDFVNSYSKKQVGGQSS
jgi:hypothetical protein